MAHQRALEHVVSALLHTSVVPIGYKPTIVPLVRVFALANSLLFQPQVIVIAQTS